MPSPGDERTAKRWMSEFSDEEIAELAELLGDPEKMLALLPEEEQRAYRESQQSIIDAAHWFRP